ncbi:hypothetical protein B0H10DRAFT_2013418 [Mycena sp. CBHHK59/15]|nr:hypothetical protein B0H10DRAFT_2013418 [Mycena sp. CBHHK59/15]
MVHHINALLLVSSWLNMCLYIVEIGLTIQYFQRSSRPFLHQVGVVSLLLFDTVCTIGICAQTYLKFPVSPCIVNDVPLKDLLWPVTLKLVSTYSTASIEQLYLCSLYFALTKNRVVTGGLFILILVHLGFSYASAILVLTTKLFWTSAFTTSKVGAITCSATDMLIAACLCWKLFTMDSSCVVGRSTHSLVRRLMVIILTSGTIVASVTGVAMILLVKENPAFEIFFNIQGRVYTVTILGNFLISIPIRPLPTEVNQSRMVGTVEFNVESYQSTSPDPLAVGKSPDTRASEPSLDNYSQHHESLNLRPLPVKLHPD